ncbi:hypothetical protein JCM4814A_08090 [Streptomyces phaeofaciens JCM 4814]|uniref:Uncharacterized protein n=1 Tax=Streptomyces phaeofaciens TaxID=68254 RepID=A0A918HKN0_9ACTN|nr:hypothetical protein GCM10010226_49980 [Streptomyces phaeofaciens]
MRRRDGAPENLRWGGLPCQASGVHSRVAKVADGMSHTLFDLVIRRFHDLGMTDTCQVPAPGADKGLPLPPGKRAA